MKRHIVLLLISVLLPVMLYSQDAWRLPGTEPVSRHGKFPRLLNYVFRTDKLIESNNSSTYLLEERLSQWNVVIVHPDSTYSFSKVHANNPDIKILAWIPAHGPGEWDDLYNGYKPEWNCVDASGDTIIASWGQPIANLFADDMGYAKHIYNFLSQRQTSFDGVYLDCLWESNWFNADIDLNGSVNSADRDSLRSAQIFLTNKIKEINPGWWIIGHNTIPWSDACELYDYTDGTIHINALGNQYADSSWNFTWSTYNRIDEREPDTFVHFVNVDVRCNRSYEEAAVLTELTENDKRRFRLGLVGSMLQDNIYFAFDRGDILHGQMWWFDEYDVELGDPLDDYQRNIYGDSVLSREFEFGTIILNQNNITVDITFDEYRTDVSYNYTAMDFEVPANDARIFAIQEPEVPTYCKWENPHISPKDTSRNSPRLVNYAHRYDIIQSTYGTHNLEERLAQWDVIILNPDYNLINKNFSHELIRDINPGIKILAWIPMQGPGPWDSLYHGYDEVWNLKTTTGEFFEPWGFPLANPFIDSYGYSKHMIDFIENKVEDDVDGIMFDVMLNDPWSGADINEDGILDNRDKDSLRASQVYLLTELRKLHPDWILTGNGGVPWAQYVELYDYANGPMHENALGNEFGDPGWEYTWNAYSYIGDLAQEPVYHFINVDLRMDRTQEEAQMLDSLTSDDMRRFRLGLIGTMLRDYGYFGFDRGDCLHGQLWWFKEYNTDLGDPLGDFETGTYGANVLSREFENATIVLNPNMNSIEVVFDEKHTDVSFDIDSTIFIIPPQDARIYILYQEPPVSINNPVAEQSNVKQLKIFPNPSSDIINICLDISNECFMSIEIVNIYGQLVKTLHKSFIGKGEFEFKSDVSSLNPGIYLIRIDTGKGLIYNKLIIQ